LRSNALADRALERARVAPVVPARPRAGARVRPVPAWARAVLRVPLAMKLVGANVLVFGATSAIVLLTHLRDPRSVLLVLLAAAAIGLAASTVLVLLALRPVRELESTAARVWRGDFAARVAPSLLADREIARAGQTLNLLLDGLTSDRARMRQLAMQVISAQDAERARIARELHDSTAQTLAGLSLQLSAAARDCADPACTERLEGIRALATEALEEVRTLSHTVYPRVLDDLGLPAALGWLARRTREQRELEIEVEADVPPEALSPIAGATLYRVAQESLLNATKHAAPRRVRIALGVEGGSARLTVEDDGTGFDVAEAESRRPGMGLFAMRERIALVHGRLEIDSAPGRGTRVTATVPLGSTEEGEE
jgi:signal transduction histidine kinase